MGCDDDIRKKEIIHNFTKKPGEPEGGNQTIASFIEMLYRYFITNTFLWNKEGAPVLMQ